LTLLLKHAERRKCAAVSRRRAVGRQTAPPRPTANGRATGGPTAIPPSGVERALAESAGAELGSERVDRTEEDAFGQRQPQRAAGASGRRRQHSRYIPAAVRRAVWKRDAGRCTYVGTDGRCRETGLLEYHHVVPYANGGEATVANLQLACRRHNASEADRYFGVPEPPDDR
jgi:hypothetical protein